MSLTFGKTNKNKAAVINGNRYSALQIKYMQAENEYNQYLLQFTNIIMDNIRDYRNPSREELNAALEKARNEYEQMNEAIEAEKAYKKVKMELETEYGKQTEELKSYFMN